MTDKPQTLADAHFVRAAERFEHSPISKQLAALTDKIFPLLTLDKNQHWLDFGAGTGAVSVPLAEHVGQVPALDTSSAMLAKLIDSEIVRECKMELYFLKLYYYLYF